MPIAQTASSTGQRPLRLWPGVAAVALQWFLWLVFPVLVPGTTGGYISVFGGLIAGLLVIVWWLFFSRAAWLERLGAIALMVVASFATRPFLDVSVATAGMGMLQPIYSIPVFCLALVVWAALTRRLSNNARWATLVATIVVAAGGWALVRSNGTFGSSTDFSFRWSPTPEDRLLASEGELATRAAGLPAAVETMEAEWPGFRGPDRNGVVPGVRIATDWSQSPPVELWRRPLGPGWSSFAVRGDFLYTQEQRGEDEVVSCYRASTGEPIWRHRDAARFYESQGGAGPRGTPTLSGGRVYTFGATGVLNVLDARDGSVVWSRHAASETGVKVPYWGFSGSPLVVDDLVVVAVAGQLAAYDLETGDSRWVGPNGGVSYSSPHLLRLDGVSQILLTSEAGVVSVAPTDGTVLWEHDWPGYPIVQPALTADGDVLVSANESAGIRRLTVEREASGWMVEERWTSIRLKPYFNDFVVHEGHAYGFDGSRLASIDIATGERDWKGGRYGQGQLVLLADQDLLLVVSEQGDLALVSARPDGFSELARMPAMDGKTWNHPVVVGDRLLVRNGEEMVAYRLPGVRG